MEKGFSNKFKTFMFTTSVSDKLLLLEVFSAFSYINLCFINVKIIVFLKVYVDLTVGPTEVLLSFSVM